MSNATSTALTERPRSAVHPLKLALLTAAERCAGFQPHRIVDGYASLDDAKALTRDLEDFCRRVVDPVVQAYGDYAAQHWDGIDLDLAKDQLLGALQGNLTYEIESAAEQADQDTFDYADDDAAEMARGLEGVS
jgi:hypothetical protein